MSIYSCIEVHKPYLSVVNDIRWKKERKKKKKENRARRGTCRRRYLAARATQLGMFAAVGAASPAAGRVLWLLGSGRPELLTSEFGEKKKVSRRWI
jgi:anti-sigma factor RsiW